MTPSNAQSRLRGSIAPIVTPFAKDGSLDPDAFRRLIERSIAAGSHGISVTGTTGEPSSLTMQEREQVIRIGSEAVAGRVPFVPGTGSNNLSETLRLTAFAAKQGADACLVITPYYVRPSQEALYRYFLTVAESTTLPVIIYNIPGRTATNLEASTLARLRRNCPNIVGVKEANKDFEHVSRVIHECGRDFLVLSGIELLCYPMLAIGGAGHVSATANILPRETADIYNHVAAGRHREAIDLHYHLLPLNEVLFIETNPGPLKAALAMLGLIEPVMRLPLCFPSEDKCLQIRDALLALGLDLPGLDRLLAMVRAEHQRHARQDRRILA